ncbi:MAG: Gentisate 1,2-dioxygenase [Chloroflexi bacterium]|nr:Gentisate 1,2-dioxygenase [Chloroflexota bacterium]
MQEARVTAAPTTHRFDDTTYARWQRAEGVPIYTGSFVEDLHTAEVAVWPRVGQKGALVSLAEQQQDDGWLIEIAPGGKTEVLHHIFEACVYVVEGRGATTFWQEGGAKQTVEWETGSLFSPPLNCFYQHFNLDGARPTRVYHATTASMMMNIFKSEKAVFNSPQVFDDRYDGAEDYWSANQRLTTRLWETNLVPDLRTFQLDDAPGRGAANRSMAFSMAGNGMGAHMSEFESGTYKKAHRHGPGAHLIILTGSGFSLIWREGQPRTKVDWHEGTLFSPTDQAYHQHFNTGPEPARYLAFTFSHMIVKSRSALYGSDVSEREGGWQIEYVDEDPEIYDIWASECARNGAAVKQPRGYRAAAAV